MTSQEWAALAHWRLCRVAELAGQYGVRAQLTGNTAMGELVEQLLAAVHDDHQVDRLGPPGRS